MDYKVVNKENDNRVEAVSEDRVIGLIDYRMTAPNELTIFHTEVGEEDEGRGIAGAMTKDLLNYAQDQGYRVRPLCPYARMYVDRHPEYQDLVEY